LIVAVREKRTVEVAALLQATQEVREHIRRVRELRANGTTFKKIS
jgi:hypothetical protein